MGKASSWSLKIQSQLRIVFLLTNGRNNYCTYVFILWLPCPPTSQVVKGWPPATFLVLSSWKYANRSDK